MPACTCPLGPEDRHFPDCPQWFRADPLPRCTCFPGLAPVSDCVQHGCQCAYGGSDGWGHSSLGHDAPVLYADRLALNGALPASAERTALYWAMEELVGPDWRQIPIHADVEVWTEEHGPVLLVEVPVMDKPIRIDYWGQIVTSMRAIPITDANRAAVCALRAVAERQRPMGVR